MNTVIDGLDALHIEDLRNKEHPSIFDENEAYNMLILRLPVIAKEGVRGVSTGFVLTEEASYRYERTSGELKTLHDRFEGPHRAVDGMVDALLKSFTAYQERIEHMEESLYDDHPESTFMSHWLALKRDLLRIERILLRTVSTMEAFIEFYEPKAQFPINPYVDLHEHIERIQRSAALQLSKLDYLYNFYNVRTNEKMNRLIYVLTIISAIFLPLNLIVGFFGMNTGGLPFAQSDSGTLSAVATMLLIAGVTTAVMLYMRREN